MEISLDFPSQSHIGMPTKYCFLIWCDYLSFIYTNAIKTVSDIFDDWALELYALSVTLEERVFSFTHNGKIAKFVGSHSVVVGALYLWNISNDRLIIMDKFTVVWNMEMNFTWGESSLQQRYIWFASQWSGCQMYQKGTKLGQICFPDRHYLFASRGISYVD